MKQFIVTLTGEAASLTAEQVHTLLTDDLGWEVNDVGVEEHEPVWEDVDMIAVLNPDAPR